MIQILNGKNKPLKETGDIKKYFDQLLAKKDTLGFLQLPFSENKIQPTLSRGEEIRSKAKALCYLGIGGSALGAQTIHQCFLESPQYDHTYFFDNVDPVSFQLRLEKLKTKYNLSEIHWVVVSKSGGTAETLAQVNFIYDYFSDDQFFNKDNTTVISSLNENPLTNWASKNEVPVLELPLNVGGRFSVLTPVGLIPAIWLGVNPLDMLEGAKWSLKKEYLVSSYVFEVLSSLSQKKWISAFWMYTDRLYTWGLWVQQLWAESLAKSETITGEKPARISTPLVLKGAIDQHSVLQQVMEGEPDKFFTFVDIKSDQEYGAPLKKSFFESQKDLESKTLGSLLFAEAKGTMSALSSQNIPFLHFQVDTLNAQSLGALFMFMELVVGTLGEVFNIDAYNQPGVELSKKLTKEFLVSSH